MAEKKPLVGRGGMMIDEKGTNRVLGFWNGEVPTDARGWRGRAYTDYKTTLGVAQRIHELNLALSTSKNNRPLAWRGDPTRVQPVPDAVVRQQLAKQDLKKLAEVKARLGALDGELMATRQSLQAYEWDNSISAVMSRQEIRAHLRGMDEATRRTALRKFEYRQAALETLPELSGLSESYHAALTEEQLRFRHGPAMASLDEARAAHESALLAHETATMAAENEMKAAGGQIKEPAPKVESKPWIED
jgi:hypothetical protein